MLWRNMRSTQQYNTLIINNNRTASRKRVVGYVMNVNIWEQYKKNNKKINKREQKQTHKTNKRRKYSK